SRRRYLRKGWSPAFRRRYLWKCSSPAVYGWCSAILLVSATNRWCPGRSTAPPASSRGTCRGTPGRQRRARHQRSGAVTCGRAGHQRYTAGVQRYCWYRPQTAGVHDHHHHLAARRTSTAGPRVTQPGAAADTCGRLVTSVPASIPAERLVTSGIYMRKGRARRRPVGSGRSVLEGAGVLGREFSGGLAVEEPQRCDIALDGGAGKRWVALQGGGNRFGL
ncbi:hypothetical protein SAMN02745244_02254, partial [Tessaracoccus bendigoensis DSM 12906]